jgi:hypothetical protein
MVTSTAPVAASVTVALSSKPAVTTIVLSWLHDSEKQRDVWRACTETGIIVSVEYSTSLPPSQTEAKRAPSGEKLASRTDLVWD